MADRSQRGTAAVPRAQTSAPTRTNAERSHLRMAAAATARPASPAEAAQARRFEKILRAEIAELVALPAEARAEARPRIQELDRLLTALRNRFPYVPEAATPAGHRQPSTSRPPRALLN
jgi:hypothetical protein